MQQRGGAQPGKSQALDQAASLSPDPAKKSSRCSGGPQLLESNRRQEKAADLTEGGGRKGGRDTAWAVGHSVGVLQLAGVGRGE